MFFIMLLCCDTLKKVKGKTHFKLWEVDDTCAAIFSTIYNFISRTLLWIYCNRSTYYDALNDAYVCDIYITDICTISNVAPHSFINVYHLPMTDVSTCVPIWIWHILIKCIIIFDRCYIQILFNVSFQEKPR